MEPSNRRRVLRALEVSLGSGRPFSSFGPGMEVYPEIDCQLVGLHFERGELDARIASRLEAQLEQGFEDEVRALVDEGIALSRTAFQAIGYREMLEVVRGTMTIHDATAEILRRSRRLARRQLAWLRRDPRITWMDATTPDLEHRLIELVGARDSTARR
jgi:tRNA dimethylallyltransferase